MLIKILNNGEWITLGSDDAVYKGLIQAIDEEENEELDETEGQIIQVRYKDLLKNDRYVIESGMNPWGINEGQLTGNEWIEVDLSLAIKTGLIDVSDY